MARSFVLSLFLLLALASCSEGGVERAGEIESRIEAITTSLVAAVRLEGEPEVSFTLADRMIRHKVPGISIAVIRNNEIEWARGFGVADVTTGRPVTPETLFQAASISKPVAAMAMLDMVEEGLLDLDTNVNEYLTSWSLPENEFTADNPVTLRRIVSHSAGLTVSGFMGYASTDDVPTTPEILDGSGPANSGAVRVDIPVESQWRYSGGGLTIMQLVMADVAGKSFPAIMTERVLGPLNMGESTYEQPLPERLYETAAFGYNSDGEAFSGKFFTHPEMAAAGLWTTPSDLARLAIEVQLSVDGNANAVLSQSMSQDFISHQFANWGLGWALRGEEGEVYAFSHGGSNQGYRSILFARTEGRDGVAIMTNGENGGGLFGEVLIAVSRQYGWGEFESEVRQIVEVDASVLDSYVGEYEITTPVSATVYVARTDRGITTDIPGFSPLNEYFPGSETAFFDLTGNEFEFVIAEDGTVEAIDFGNVRAEKVK